jgi:hypothetical protein
MSGAVQENSNKSVESTMFVVGAKSAAKTSIILRFLDRYYFQYHMNVL